MQVFSRLKVLMGAWFSKPSKAGRLFDANPRLSSEQIQRFQNKQGKSAVRVLSSMGKAQPFYLALQSDIGQELLKDGIGRLEVLLDLIVSEAATKQELAEYRALKSVVDIWSERIADYLKTIGKIAKGE